MKIVERAHRAVSRTRSVSILPLSIVVLVAAPAIRLGLPLGQVLALLSIPIWLPFLLKQPALLAMCATFLAMGVGGLTLLSSTPYAVDTSVAVETFGLLVVCSLPVGVFAWCADRAGLGLTAVAYASGLLLQVSASGFHLDENAWKYSLGMPTTLALLGLSAHFRRAWIAVVGVAVVLIASAIGSYRSLILIIVGAVGLYFLSAWVQRRFSPREGQRDLRAVMFFGVSAMLAVAISQIVPRLLLAGAFGVRAQEVTARQIAQSGGLLSGGRYEVFATLVLMQQRIVGYGPGAIPTRGDLALVLAALDRAGVVPSLQHVRNYMLGTRFKLHSMYGDLWINFGLVSAAFLIVALSILVAFAIAASTRYRATLLCWTLFAWAIWDIAFSPIYTNLRHLVFGLTLLTTCLVHAGPVVRLSRTPAFARSASFT